MEVLSPEDTIRENNYAEGFVVVKPKGSCCWFRNPSRAASFASFWKDLDCRWKNACKPVAHTDTPSKYDAVVLQMYPAFCPRQMASNPTLETREGAAGDRRRSATAGDYSSSPWRDTSSFVRAPAISGAGDLALILVITSRAAWMR